MVAQGNAVSLAQLNLEPELQGDHVFNAHLTRI
jgi:hypothetical protein